MSVVVSIQDAGPCRKRLSVEVPGAAVEAEIARVVEDLRRRTKLPGFRQGRVPAEMVRRRYRDDIRQEVLDRLLPRYWRQAAEESKVEPLAPPEVEQVELEVGQPLTFVATVEIRPEIRLGNIHDFELPEGEVEPAQEDVERALEDLRRSVSPWRDVARPALPGDLVRGELREIGEEVMAAEPRPVAVEIGDPQVWPELSQALTGIAAGEQVELTRRDAGTERRFQARALEVRERELVPLDDDFAKRLGRFESLVDLEGDLRVRLRAARTEERRRRRERAVLDQLRSRHPLVLPEGVVGREVEEMVREYAEELVSRGVDLERTGIEWGSLREQVRPEAERRIHGRLLLDAVADAGEIEVGEDEFERALAGIARAQGSTTVAVRQTLDRGGGLAALRRQLRRDKVLRRLAGEEPAGEASADEAPMGEAMLAPAPERG